MLSLWFHILRRKGMLFIVIEDNNMQAMLCRYHQSRLICLWANRDLPYTQVGCQRIREVVHQYRLSISLCCALPSVWVKEKPLNITTELSEKEIFPYVESVFGRYFPECELPVLMDFKRDVIHPEQVQVAIVEAKQLAVLNVVAPNLSLVVAAESLAALCPEGEIGTHERVTWACKQPEGLDQLLMALWHLRRAGGDLPVPIMNFAPWRDQKKWQACRRWVLHGGLGIFSLCLVYGLVGVAGQQWQMHLQQSHQGAQKQWQHQKNALSEIVHLNQQKLKLLQQFLQYRKQYTHIWSLGCALRVLMMMDHQNMRMTQLSFVQETLKITAIVRDYTELTESIVQPLLSCSWRLSGPTAVLTDTKIHHRTWHQVALHFHYEKA